MTRKSVMDEIKQRTEVHTIKIIGSEEDKDDAMYILMNTQDLIAGEDEVYHGIKNRTLELLRNAEIRFKIIEEEYKSK